MNGIRIVREITQADRQLIVSMIGANALVHRHLDWRSPEDWIGYQPYYLLGEVKSDPASEDNLNSLAIMACMPEVPEIAWIRVFALQPYVEASEAWRFLWPVILAKLKNCATCKTVAVVTFCDWFEYVLDRTDFVHSHDVVTLLWKGKEIPVSRGQKNYRIRQMHWEDLPLVAEVDKAAFPPVWQLSLETLKLAYYDAALALVAVEGENVIGYQVSSASPSGGGHLVRLAVLPTFQGLGVGYELVREVLSFFYYHYKPMVTVNTQHDNIISLRLYDKMGFQLTGEKYPVYELNLSSM